MLNNPFWRKQRITQEFGENPAMYKRFGWLGHNGMDFGVKVGTHVFSTHAGICTVGDDGNGYGKHIKIKRMMHDGGYETIYAHLSEIYVKNGQAITPKLIIGKSGNTGNSTGPHLHFGVRFYDKDGNLMNRNNGYGGWENPRKYFIEGKI